jgi:hypothetical protein
MTLTLLFLNLEHTYHTYYQSTGLTHLKISVQHALLVVAHSYRFPSKDPSTAEQGRVELVPGSLPYSCR